MIAKRYSIDSRAVRFLPAILGLLAFAMPLIGAPDPMMDVPGESFAKTMAPEQAIRDRSKLTLVDLRELAVFQKVHIPGSLNLPLFALKTRSYLKRKPLVLVAGGVTDLTQAVKQLETLGFGSVSVLQGGLYGWYLASGPLAGDPFAINRLGLMDPALYSRMKNQDRWEIVALVQPGTDLGEQAIKMVPVEGTTPEEAVFEAIAQREKGARVLFLDQAGEWETAILAALTETADPNAFCLAGGLEAWLEMQRGQSSRTATARIQTSGEASGHKHGKSTTSSCGCGKN